MKPKRKAISLLLTICLVVGLMPTVALAADDTGKAIQLGTAALNEYASAFDTVILTADTTAIDFGRVHTDYNASEIPDARTITITNTGNQIITLTQPTAVYYTVGTLSATELAAGKTAAFTLRPKASPELEAAGTYNETIAVQGTNDINTTNTINITAVFTVGDTDKKAIELGTAALNEYVNKENAPSVYFGQNHENDPAAWRVIGYENSNVGGGIGNMTLFAAKNMGITQFAPNVADGGSNQYATSDLKSKVDALAEKLTNEETAAVDERTLASGSYIDDNTDCDCVAGDAVSDAFFWPLSTKEARAVRPILRIRDPEYPGSSGYWWLRSPGKFNYYASNVGGMGNVVGQGDDLTQKFGVRPAFNLNLNSVLFTSAAVGGKLSGTAGADSIVKIPTSDTTEWKLTLLDSSRNFAITENTAAGKPGNTITLNYTDAAVGANEYISAIIKDSSGIQYYGRLKNVTANTDASGTVQFTIPSDLTMGSYTLNLFSEQYNGGENDDTKLTDYASAFDTVTLTVDTTAPTLTAGAATRNSETSATVKFTSNEEGQYYYECVESGAVAPSIATTGAGTSCGTAEQTIELNSLSGAGAKDIYIVVKDAVGNVSADTFKIPIPLFPTYTISADTSAIDFGSVHTGYTAPAAQTITITNTGNQQITLTQPTAENYTVGTLSATELAAGETADFTLQPKDGLAADTYNETIDVQGTNGSNTTNTINITAGFTVRSKSSSPSYSYFTITANAGTGGSISPSGEDRVSEGLDKTYTITPENGYAISDVLVDGKSVGAVSSYTFDKVQKSHTIEAQFIDAGANNPFSDVKETDWFYKGVLFVYNKGIMLGTSDTAFSPESTATRAMMAAIIWRMEGSPVPSGKNPFTDVPAGEYYTDAVIWANEQGIFDGYNNALFGTNDPITRQQLAAIFYRYAGYKGCDLTPTADLDRFTDNGEIADWAQTAVQWSVSSGLMSGTSSTTFDSQSQATRAQIAAMLHRFSNLLHE